MSLPTHSILVFHRRNPFVAFLLPFVLGILIASYISFNAYISGAFLSVLALLLFFIHKGKGFNSYKYNHWFILIVYAILFVFAGTITTLKQPKTFYADTTKETYVTVELLEAVKIHNSIGTARAKLLKVFDSTERIVSYPDTKMMLTFKEDKYPDMEDVIIFKASKTEEIEKGKIPYKFDYSEYLISKGITNKATLFPEEWEKVEQRHSITALAQKIRNYVISKLSENGLNNNELALVSALAFGEKQYLSKGIKTAYSKAGAMHVLAISGLHIGIVYAILLAILKIIPRKKSNTLPEVMFLLIGIWLFAFVSGLGISVVRAALMFSIMAIGRMYERHLNIYNSIALAAFILLVINPFALFDIGFQLSFTAVTGIVYFYPYVNGLFLFSSPFLTKLWEITSVSIVAQMITLPLTIYYFHNVPLYGLLSNLFVIYFATVILIMVFLSILFIPVPFVFSPIVKLLDKIVQGLNFLIDKVANLPHSTIDNLYINKIELALLSVMMVALLLLVKNWKNKKTHKIVFASFFFCCCWIR